MKNRNKSSLEMKVYDSEDSKQECNAYLKTKLFMAKRINEQQKEIDALKLQLTYQHNKYDQIYEILENLNYNQVKNKELSDQDISGELVDSIIIDDNSFNKGDLNSKLITSNLPVVNSANNNLDFNNINDKIINKLKLENLELNRKYDIINLENTNNKIKINKLIYDKFILYTELSELVNSLKRVDLNILNEFYKNNINKDNLKNDFIHSMGIKFNILSANSQMSLLNNINNVNKINYESVLNLNNNNNCCINIEKYNGLIKAYEEELNTILK